MSAGMTEADVAICTWHLATRLWVFEPGDPEPGQPSARAGLGRDPIEAMAQALPAENSAAPNLVGTVNRAAFDRRHVFIVAFDAGWSCWQFEDVSAFEANDPIRCCDGESPEAAAIACFQELGALTIERVQ